MGDTMTDADLRFRTATGADLAAMVEIETGPDTTRYIGVTGRDYHERALADDDQEQIVAEAADGTVVGFVVLAGLRDGGGSVELRRIVVSHRHRGRGTGRRLFRAAVARAYARHGAREVWLDVKPDNARAQALYESEGFRRCGTIPDPMDPDGVLLLMTHTPETGTDQRTGRE
ncbi:MAG TPA: GNAT family N-acetyltransferase [Micromonosporaceae bacterium]